MKTAVKTLLCIALLLLAGCGYRYYLGMHGPSIWNFPDSHDTELREDSQCLECHGTEENDAGAPATSHPDFHGCLNCHNNPVQN